MFGIIFLLIYLAGILAIVLVIFAIWKLMKDHARLAASMERMAAASGFYGEDGGVYGEDRRKHQAESDQSLSLFFLSSSPLHLTRMEPDNSLDKWRW